MKLYGDQRSGNCYKIQLTAAWLNISLDWVAVDILQGQTQAPEFLQMNPGGKIPLLQLGDGRYLSESNAIVNFLAHESNLLSIDRYSLALIQQWQFFEQYSHEPYIAVARFINKFQGMPADRQAEFAAKQQGGHKALFLMEQQLSVNQFLVGEYMTVADICLYAYTHVADEGGFDLSLYPAINQWLDRIKNHPNYVPMGSE